MSELERELKNVGIEECLSTIEFEAQHEGNKVNVHLAYVLWEEDGIATKKLLEFIKDCILIKFIITHKEIQKQYRRRDKIEADSRLYQKAIRKITSSTAKGKIGELLLYIFLEHYFEAPKILSKLSNLDDPNCQVKGADAVHAQYIDNELFLYLGESKLWKEYSGACKNAIDSIKTTLESYKEEFDLIESNIDFPNINDELEEKIIKILDPYEESNLTPIIHSPCFIGFESCICKISTKEEYLAKYQKLAQAKINTFFDKANMHFDYDDITLILLPFESIDNFTSDFIETLGIEDGI